MSDIVSGFKLSEIALSNKDEGGDCASGASTDSDSECVVLACSKRV